MSQAGKIVKIKLEIKGSPSYKFEFKGTLEHALTLAIYHLQAFRKEVAHLGIEE